MSNRRMIVGDKPKDTKSAFLKLINYLGENSRLLFIAIACSALTTLGALYGSYAISPIIQIVENGLNQVISVNEAMRLVVQALITLGIVYIVEVIVHYISGRIMIVVSQKTVKRIREDLFSKVMRIPISLHDKYTHGELMSRFTNDVDLVSEALNISAGAIITSVLSLTGTVVLMLALSPLMGIICCVIIPLLSVLSRYIVNASKKFTRLSQKSLGDLNGNIEEAIEGQMVLQLFNHEQSQFNLFAKLGNYYRGNAFKAQSYSNAIFPVMMNMNNINYTLMGVIGGFLVLNGHLSIANLSAFVLLTKQLGRPINEISMQYTSIQSALASAERIFEVMSWENEPVLEDEVELTDIKGDVKFEDVTFGYVENQVVLNHISFYAHPGQKIAIVGSTGAGKTTITNLISRFYDVNSGMIKIDDMDITKINRFSLRKHIAMVLQDTHLFTGSVLENIRYGNLDASDEECIEAAKLANADSFIEKLEHGYNTIISGTGTELSVGQRQLLNIARAAVANPKILILDEATSSIDTRTERLIEKGMDRLMEGRTTFVIAHRLSTVRNANAILVVEKGEIIERGDHDNLVAQNGRYAALYSGQTNLT
jgi:ABC-type multidrug transport system, ATPase and permease components